jgi:hypothetical protein
VRTLLNSLSHLAWWLDWSSGNQRAVRSTTFRPPDRATVGSVEQRAAPTAPAVQGERVGR